MKTVELYFEDLSKEKQKELLNLWGIDIMDDRYEVLLLHPLILIEESHYIPERPADYIVPVIS